MLCHLNLIPSFCFVLSNHYMPLYMLLCGPKIRNKYLVSCIKPVRVEPSLRRSWHPRGRGLIRLIIVLKTNYFVCFLYSLNTNRIRGVLNVQGAHAIFLKR